MTVTVVSTNSHDKSAQLVAIQAHITQLAAVVAPNQSQVQLLKQRQEELVRGILDFPSNHFTAAQIISSLQSSQQVNLSGVAINGTAGQFTCTAATLLQGEQLTISGTLGGTGSINGYVNPTTYLLSATNGSTTFTLTTLAGAALTTSSGTPTGLTYLLSFAVFTPAWLAKYAPMIAQITANIAANPLTAANQQSILVAEQNRAIDLALSQGLISPGSILANMT